MLQETKIEGQALLEISGKSGIKVLEKQSVQGEHLEDWQPCGLKTYFSTEQVYETQHWIYTELKHKASKFSISLCNLYVPISYSEK
jgi:hypothetical protein